MFADFECAGDEVLVESSPPASPDMAARLAQPAQVTYTLTTGAGGGTSPSAVRELIVIPEIPNSIHLQHAIQQVSSTVVEVNGDSSGHSSPTTEAQHTYITVAMQGAWKVEGDPIKVEANAIKVEAPADHELTTPWKVDVDPNSMKRETSNDYKSEGGNGVNYHVQYVEPQELYGQGHQGHMDPLRSYPVYGVATVGNATSSTEATSADNSWGGASSAEYTAYGVVVAGDEAETPASPATPGAAPRMPPATVQWLLDNYETAEGVSLPRSTLYAHYLRHCATHRLDPVNAASFGKLIRSVFIGLRTRRLGTRGNSKYHYYGIRAKPTAGHDGGPAHEPANDKTEVSEHQDSRDREPEQSGASPCSIPHRQYLGAVTPPDPPELELDEMPEDVPRSALQVLRRHHREHGVEFLEAVAALDTAGVERTRRAFWRRPPPELCRRELCKLTARKEVADWLRKAELELYQKAVELLLPDVLRPIPPQLTQAIRNFAKSLESALAAGAGGAPAAAARAQASAAAALAAALRRYTSLNHLAQAARAVLTNHHQIQQMLADLNRVDFRVVREQAAWACSCTSAATAHRLEADFKATLGRGASLEQWAAWLEGCVRGALAAHERAHDYTQRARRLLLHWSFYSSLVIRELTLRSAASFGSFHLIRLLYDEYVSYVIERRVAAHSASPPIAVMQRPQEDEEDIPEDASREDEADPDDPEWEWDDDEEDDDDSQDCKKVKLSCG
ncbi:DNA-binding protein RFX2-like isoform X2 [Pectinophora gossypiella]|uniref:DNA-binding protein RFX2-like isoform X2 n=1 Tax=Pectinophora gossypiella TaxID=13191 RepID=UPI00214F608E|nr:DNA-binding protein RFX2-like isoform X2 [Pectinophora gossypiella]